MARSIAISGHFHIWLISTVHKIVPQDLVDIRLNRKSTKPHSVHAHMNELKMGLSWSSAHGKVQNNSQLNEEKEEDDSDTNGEEIFYETEDVVSSQNNDLVVQELGSQSMSLPPEELYRRFITERGVNLDEFPGGGKIPRSDIHEESRVVDGFDIRNTSATKYEETVYNTSKLTNASWRDKNIPTKEPYIIPRAAHEVRFLGEEKLPHSVCERTTNTNNFNNNSTESEETAGIKLSDPRQSVNPLTEEEERVKECSYFSLPLISEEKVVFGKHAKSISKPEISRSAISSHQLKSEIPSSCAWQIDVDCFKSKKRKKPPQKYLRSKENGIPSNYNEGYPRSASSERQELSTIKCLVATEIATQEMMERRKVLDLRRW